MVLQGCRVVWSRGERRHASAPTLLQVALSKYRGQVSLVLNVASE